MAESIARGDETKRQLSFVSSDFNHDKYSDVARCARLVDVRLVNGSFSLKPELIGVLEDPSGDFTLDFNGKLGSFGFDAENGLAVGAYEWTAGARQKKKKALAVSAKYLLVYRNLQGKEYDYVRLYYQKLSRFTSYPYFRAYFSQNTASANIALPPLPSLTERVD